LTRSLRGKNRSTAEKGERGGGGESIWGVLKGGHQNKKKINRIYYNGTRQGEENVRGKLIGVEISGDWRRKGGMQKGGSLF